MSEKERSISDKGRSYVKGLALGTDLRELIISDMLRHGADINSGNLPYGLISLMASKYSVSKSTVHKLWRQYHSTGNLREKPHSGGNKLKLSDEDIEYVQALKHEKPSMTLKSIQSKLLENANRDVSLNTISKTIRHRLPHGNWSYKVMSRPAGDRFSDRNIQYTHAFIDVIRNRDPVRIKFMDEAGFCLPDAASATRGHAPVGQRCVEIQDIKKSQKFNS